MTPTQRKSYISAVQCMFSAPAKSDPAQVPGAKTRYDDFVAQHINQTLTIHRTGNFLSWHRMYMHAYEKALRDECGYDGALPYWNWFTYQSNLKDSPVFDGSDTSMGGDGEYVKHNGSVGGGGTVALPSGAGGGCIKSGPFKKYVPYLSFPLSCPTFRQSYTHNGEVYRSISAPSPQPWRERPKSPRPLPGIPAAPNAISQRTLRRPGSRCQIFTTSPRAMHRTLSACSRTSYKAASQTASSASTPRDTSRSAATQGTFTVARTIRCSSCTIRCWIMCGGFGRRCTRGRRRRLRGRSR